MYVCVLALTHSLIFNLILIPILTSGAEKINEKKIIDGVRKIDFFSFFALSLSLFDAVFTHL
jgi:hypothetical protein